MPVNPVLKNQNLVIIRFRCMLISMLALLNGLSVRPYKKLLPLPALPSTNFNQNIKNQYSTEHYTKLNDR